MASLIPGLPNDVALQCLMRLPAHELPRMKLVNFLWNFAISSHRFYIQRKRSFPSPYILIINQHIGGRFEFLDSDLADLSSPPRSLLSCDKSFFPPNVIFAHVLDCVFVLSPGASVQRLSLLSWRWTLMDRSIPFWCKITFASLRRLLFVVMYDAGRDDDVEAETRDTICEMYNSENDSWCTVQGLPQRFRSQTSFTCQDRLYLRGLSDGDIPLVYAFDPRQKTWEYDNSMTRRMDGLDRGEKSQTVARPDGTIMCAVQQGYSIRLVLQSYQSTNVQLNTSWINVLSLMNSADFSLMAKDNQIVLVVSDPRNTWRCQPIPHLTIMVPHVFMCGV